MDIIRTLREVTARRGALYAYQRYADAHRERETALLMLGFDAPADGHMRAERLVLRAYQAELDDPEPAA